MFFDPPPRVMKIKTKINKWDLMKLKSFCTAKETINKMKRQPTDWENIFASDATDNGLISEINKRLMQLSINKQTKNSKAQKNKQLNKKMGRRPKQTFLQRRDTDGQQTHETMLNITNYQRNANQNYNEVSLHTDQSGHHQNIYKLYILDGEGVEKREPSCTVGGNVN